MWEKRQRYNRIYGKRGKVVTGNVGKETKLLQEIWEKRQSYNRRYGKRDKVITGDMGKET
jgi:hypothetical protein